MDALKSLRLRDPCDDPDRRFPHFPGSPLPRRTHAGSNILNIYFVQVSAAGVRVGLEISVRPFVGSLVAPMMPFVLGPWSKPSKTLTLAGLVCMQANTSILAPCT